MAIKQIIEYPQKFLRKKSSKVEIFDESLRRLVTDMTDTMRFYNGCGLAAPQIGLHKQVVIVDIGEGLKSFINPKILNRRGEKYFMEEGCLSVPGITVEVKRSEKITLQWMALDGDAQKSDFDGFMARALQHEIDHLIGRLIVDYLNPFQKFMYTRKAAG